MAKRIAIIAALTLGTPIAAALGFYLWASGDTLPAGEYQNGNIIVADDFDDATPHNPLTIVTYNVGYASGLTNNSGNNASETEYDANLNTMIAALQEAKPDLVAFQEIDYASERSYGRHQLRLIADALGLKYRAQAYNWDTRYLPFPYWPPSSHFGQVLSGQAVASAFPVLQQSKLTLIKPEERPFYYNNFYLDRLIHITEIDLDGTTLTLLNVHLEAFMGGTRQKQSLEVVEAVKQHMDGPLILLGDFNAQPPWIGERADREGESDATIANILEGTGLNKAIPETEYGDSPETSHLSFPSDTPNVALDHIFYNDHIERLSARVLHDAGTGSDHLPVLMTFRLKPQAPAGV